MKREGEERGGEIGKKERRGPPCLKCVAAVYAAHAEEQSQTQLQSIICMSIKQQ